VGIWKQEDGIEEVGWVSMREEGIEKQGKGIEKAGRGEVRKEKID
jgi:hypothetical protein